MTNNEKYFWTIDANIFIDFIIGTMYMLYKKSRKDHRYSSNIKILLEEALRKKFELIANKFSDKNVALLISSQVLKEVKDVLKREIRKIEERTRKTRYPLILDPDEIYNNTIELLRIYRIINDVDTKSYESYTMEKLKEYHINYDREDIHLISLVYMHQEVNAVFSDEENVLKAIKYLIKYENKYRKIQVGIFSDFLASLRLFGILSLDDLALIGYYAYELQRLPYSHEQSYNAGIRKDKELLGLWIEYAVRRVKGYIYVQLKDLLRKNIAQRTS